MIADDGITTRADEASAESFPSSDPPAIDDDEPEANRAPAARGVLPTGRNGPSP